VNRQKYILGDSLVELLIALFLVSLITSILIQAYTFNKRLYLSVENKLEQHFDVQWIRDLLSDSIRGAGFTPCINIEHLEVVDRRVLPKYINNEAITIKANMLQVNRMGEQFVELMALMSPQQILVSPEPIFQKHSSIIIADCEHAEIHKIKQIEKTALGSVWTLDAPVLFEYPSVTYVGQWVEELWFIKKNREEIPALFFKQMRSEELSPLIHSLMAKETSVSGRRVMSITLGLDNEKTQHLMVAIRS
jgi:hypothetical protein